MADGLERERKTSGRARKGEPAQDQADPCRRHNASLQWARVLQGKLGLIGAMKL